jgi:hypothetical protein
MIEVAISSGKSVIISDKDRYIRKMRWTYISPKPGRTSPGYAGRVINGKFVYMHRLIMGVTEKSLLVDHINGNGLDNRRSNLRIVTFAENRMNTGVRKDNKVGFKGVCQLGNKFLAYTYRDYKRIHIGVFEKKEEAAMAYNRKVKKMYGSKAKLNTVGGRT